MKLSTKLAYNSFIQIINKFVGTILGLVVVAIMTRYLGKDGFGEYTIIVSFVSFFAVIADLGLTLVTTQMINGIKVNQDKLLSNLFAFRFLSALFIIGLAGLVVLFFPYNNYIKSGVLIVSLSFFFVALNQVFVSVFQKFLRTDKIVIAEIVSRIILLIGVFASSFFDFGVKGIIISMVVSNFISFFLHYIFSKKFASVSFAFDKEIWIAILKKSWPMAVTIIFNLIYLRTDVLILSVVSSSSDVGVYGAAYKVIDVLTTLPFVFAGMILPIMVSSWEEGDKKRFFMVTQKFFDFTSLLILPLVIGGIILAKPIMYFVAGSDFGVSGDILKILLLGLVFVFYSCLFTHVMLAFSLQKKLISSFCFTALSALAFYLIFIPKYSYTAAAWVTVYSEASLCLLSLFLVYRYSDKFVFKLNIFFKALSAALLMGFILYFVSHLAYESAWWFTIILIFGAAIYTFFIFVFKAIKLSDLKILKITN